MLRHRCRRRFFCGLGTSGHALDERERFEDEVGRSVAVAALELQGYTTVRREAQTLTGDGASRAVTEHLLQARSVAGTERDIGV